MVSICKLILKKDGRVLLPKSFVEANNLSEGDVLTIKPMVNKKNAVALFWDENKKQGETNEVK